MMSLAVLAQVLKSQLFVDKFSESVQHTFLDYLAGGCELNFMVAIDFTGQFVRTLGFRILFEFLWRLYYIYSDEVWDMVCFL